MKPSPFYLWREREKDSSVYKVERLVLAEVVPGARAPGNLSLYLARSRFVAFMLYAEVVSVSTVVLIWRPRSGFRNFKGL